MALVYPAIGRLDLDPWPHGRIGSLTLAPWPHLVPWLLWSLGPLGPWPHWRLGPIWSLGIFVPLVLSDLAPFGLLAALATWPLWPQLAPWPFGSSFGQVRQVFLGGRAVLQQLPRRPLDTATPANPLTTRFGILSKIWGKKRVWGIRGLLVQF